MSDTTIISKRDLIGPVTALHFSSDDILYIGRGSWLSAYSIITNKIIWTRCIFPGGRIHGIVSTDNTNCIAIYGQFQWTLLYHDNHVTKIQSTRDWIHCMRWMSTNNYLSIACAHGMIHIYQISSSHEETPILVKKSSCPNPTIYGITYCIDIMKSPSSSLLWIAMGTPDKHIHVWSMSLSNYDDTTNSNICNSWKAHDGAIFHIHFVNDNDELITCSEDRTVQYWKKELSSGKYECIWKAYGHTARIWKCLSIQNMIVSCGEDSTVRFWNSNNGSQISKLRIGNTIQSLWTMSYSCHHKFFAIGCNNGTVQFTPVQQVPQQEQTIALPLIVPPIIQETACSSKKKKKKKKKDSNHIVIGMNLDLEKDNLVVVDKFASIWTCHNLSQSSSWTKHTDTAINDDDVATCMAIHPQNKTIIVIGTMSGSIIVNSATNKKEIIKSSFRMISKLQWCTSDSLVSFHVKGILQLYSYHNSTFTLKYTFNTATTNNSIPLTFYSIQNDYYFVGDSRGTIAMFVAPATTEDENNMITPHHLLKNMHEKEHVTCITSSQQKNMIIWSGGNDACINQYTLIKKGETSFLQFCMSIPIPNMTGIHSLWYIKDTLYVGGYHGNVYVIWNTTTQSTLVEMNTGGRQRHQNVYFHYNNHNSTKVIGMVVLTSPQQVTIHTNTSSSSVCIGVPGHGDSIFDCCWVSTGTKSYLITGSNDCTVHLLKYDEQYKKLQHVLYLPPHESCIRAICSSNSGGTSSLFAIAGGKLQVSFYRLDSCTDQVFYLGRTKSATEIDHRINALESMVISPEHHLVVAGDSNGTLHFTCLCETIPLTGSRRKFVIPSTTITTSTARPILSLQLFLQKKNNSILIITGDTIGQVSIYSMTIPTTHIDDLSSFVLNDHEPVVTYSAHQMGTNSISILPHDDIDSDDDFLIIASGGDDQALTIALVNITSMKCTMIQTLHEASSSALKSAVLLPDYTLYTTGYAQQLAKWKIITSDHNLEVQFLQSSHIDVYDVNTMDICYQHDNVLIAVGGEGIELLSSTTLFATDNTKQKTNAILQDVDETSITKAASEIMDCDYLLITCGAGLSVDSGLPTYEDMPELYKEMCNPIQIVNSPERFYTFWKEHANTYRTTHPHDGYTILQRWCTQRRSTKSKMSPFWIYTSNVDGLFRKFPCFENTICEIHGYAQEFRCSSSIGYYDDNSNLRPRIGEIWEQWNTKTQQQIRDNDFCEVECQETKFTFAHKVCPNCQLPSRPNVLLFHDTDRNVLRDIEKQRVSYQEWEASMEREVSCQNKKLVILEIGCGTNVPAIREEGEEVFADCSGKVTFIRINPKLEKQDINESFMGDKNYIPIKGTAKKTLQQLDYVMKTLSNKN